MFILVGISAFVLLAFATLALKDFEKDKIAYVFDATQAHSITKAQYIHSNIQSLSDKAKIILSEFNPETKQFSNKIRQTIKKDPSVEFFRVLLPTDDQNFSLVDEISSNLTPAEKSKWEQLSKDFPQRVLKNDIAFEVVNAFGLWALGLKIENPNSKKPLIVIAGLKNLEFTSQFNSDQSQESYIVNTAGQVLVKPFQRIYNALKEQEVAQALKSASEAIKAEYGIKQIKLPANNEQLLVSVADIGIGNLKVASFVPRSQALEAVKRIQVKIALFLLLMIFATVLISVFTSNNLTYALTQLTAATRKISSGDFSFRLNLKNNDEIGELSDNFNLMSEEILRLLEETAEKSRMENELETAKLVQTTLFPEKSFSSDDIKVEGHYEPASECGGDWWFHSQIDGQYFLWIGDATGHGAPAALVTAAARAASSTIETLGNADPAQAMNLLNKAIQCTAKGHVLMTFFLGVYDPKTKILSYVNASHDPPFIIPHLDEPIKKKHITPLSDHTFARLGENMDTEYRASEITLNPGDRIYFYTDGVTELKGNEDKMYGERRLLKNLIASKNNNLSLKESVDNILTELEEFRDGHPLEDDVTYFMTEV